jgi:hypothetical protein
MEDLKDQIRVLEDEIKRKKLEIREERLRLKLLQAEQAKSSWGPGSHTSHPKGSDHHRAKPWDVWQRIDSTPESTYEYFGRFESIGEIARALGKDYYTVWMMKNRWDKYLSGKLTYKYPAKRKGLQYRIEEAR